MNRSHHNRHHRPRRQLAMLRASASLAHSQSTAAHLERMAEKHRATVALRLLERLSRITITDAELDALYGTTPFPARWSNYTGPGYIRISDDGVHAGGRFYPAR